MRFAVNNEPIYDSHLRVVRKGVVEYYRYFIAGIRVGIAVASAFCKFSSRNALWRKFFVAYHVASTEREFFIELMLPKELFEFGL